jgi:hypothetical protein
MTAGGARGNLIRWWCADLDNSILNLWKVISDSQRLVEMGERPIICERVKFLVSVCLFRRTRWKGANATRGEKKKLNQTGMQQSNFKSMAPATWTSGLNAEAIRCDFPTCLAGQISSPRSSSKGDRQPPQPQQPTATTYEYHHFPASS